MELKEKRNQKKKKKKKIVTFPVISNPSDQVNHVRFESMSRSVTCVIEMRVTASPAILKTCVEYHEQETERERERICFLVSSLGAVIYKGSPKRISVKLYIRAKCRLAWYNEFPIILYMTDIHVLWSSTFTCVHCIIKYVSLFVGGSVNNYTGFLTIGVRCI